MGPYLSLLFQLFLKGASKLWFKRCLVFIDEAILNKENEINRTEQTRFFCCKGVLNSLRICKKMILKKAENPSPTCLSSDNSSISPRDNLNKMFEIESLTVIGNLSHC